MGGGSAGEDGSEGWIEESGGRDAPSDARMEEYEGDHALLVALPWGMQESGERGQWRDARAGGSDSGKGTSATANGGDAGPPCGVESARGKKRRLPGMGRGRSLGSEGKLWGL